MGLHDDCKMPFLWTPQHASGTAQVFNKCDFSPAPKLSLWRSTIRSLDLRIQRKSGKSLEMSAEEAETPAVWSMLGDQWEGTFLLAFTLCPGLDICTLHTSLGAEDKLLLKAKEKCWQAGTFSLFSKPVQRCRRSGTSKKVRDRGGGS